MNGNFQWPPLESDPEIFNNYTNSLGLDDSLKFQELYSLDYKEMQVIETPVISLIVSYEKKVPFALEDIHKKGKNFLPFFMKQTEILDNACGLIAILHSLGNNISGDKVILKENSVLSKFFNEAIKIDEPVNKAKLLEECNEFKNAHAEYAGQGQSNFCSEQDDVKNHFVAFIYHEGNLVECDGLQDGPYVVKENISETNFLDEALEEIRKRLAAENITDNLALMYLTKS